VTTAFADSPWGYGTHTVPPVGEEGFTTVNLSWRFLGRAGSGERLTGIGTLTQGGRRVQTWDVVVSTEKRTVAVLRVTQLRCRKT
jgi:acyl-coenzyme A thioesterase PaaI-like protein